MIRSYPLLLGLLATHVLLSDLDQQCQVGPGLPKLFYVGEDVPPGQTSLEAEGKTGVRELGMGGEMKLGVRHQEIHFQRGCHRFHRRTLLLV